MVSRESIKDELKFLYDKGYEVGPRSRKHAVQFIQEQWNKKVLLANRPWTYFEFKAWEAGYWTSRRDAFWGIGKFNEYANDGYDD